MFESDPNPINRNNPPWIQAIKRAMSEQGVAQTDLIPFLNVTTRGAVGHYLTGRRNLSVAQLVRLIEYLQLDPLVALGIASSPNEGTT